MDRATMPAGLSSASQGVWTDLLKQYSFARPELEALAHALQWQDVSSTLLADAVATSEPEKSKLTKLAMDAATTSLRFWRTLKFTTDGTVRRPGRPADDLWSEKRKRQAMQRVK